MADDEHINLSVYSEQEVFLNVPSQPVATEYKKPHVLILLHGINTHAEWMEEIIAESVVLESFVVKPVSYGRFPTYKFLYGDLNITLYKNIINQIKGIIRSYPDHEISVMCHSFGTKLFSEVCELISFRFKYVIFLAGVARHSEAEITSRYCLRFINDFSKTDRWPKYAALLNKHRFEASGTNAFHKHWVIDRPFNYKHSDYMTKKHFLEYILPILISNTVFYPIKNS